MEAPYAVSSGLGPTRDALLEMGAADRSQEIIRTLEAFYLSRVGLEDDDLDDEDDEEPPHVDVSHPLIVESAVAAELNVVLEHWLGVTVPIETLLRGGLSIQGIAELLAEGLATGATPSSAGPPLVAHPEDRHRPFDLADIQQAYWIGRDPLYELGSVPASLLIEFEVRHLDVRRAESALQELVHRHDMLRSVVEASGRQRVLEQVAPIRVAEHDASGKDPEAVLSDVRARLSRRDTRPDLGEPFEVVAVHREDDRSVLMISVDMIKLDAWSVQLMMGEWFFRYDDPGIALPAPDLSFRDYVVWTEQIAATPSYEDDRRYWLDRIPTLPPPPDLPQRGPLADIGRPTYTSLATRMSRDRWSRLKQRATDHGLTPSMVLCAAYAEVLRTWSTGSRFTLNVSSGRPAGQPELSRILGPFARPIVLEIDPPPGGFPARAQAVQAQFSRDLEHRTFGGIEVLRQLAARHGRTRAPMPVIFTSALPQAGDGGLPAPDWLIGQPSVTWTMPQLMLENQMLEVDGGLMLTWVWAEEAFPDGVVDAMFAAYRDLLEDLVDSDAVWAGREPEIRVPDRAPAPDGARTSDPVEGLLHDPFAAQVEQRPDAPAVISGRRSLDYAELDRQAGHVAATVADRTTGPDRLVGICMERGWEQVAAVLGVLRAGAAYLPIDPDLPEHRQRRLIEQGELSTVLSQPWLRDRVTRVDGVEIVDVAFCSDRPCAAGRRAAPHDLAYVIFTSGSSGEPKGVAIEHRAALNTIVDVNRRFGVGPDDRVLGVSSLSFDLSVYDVLGTLAAGGALVLPEPGIDPAGWAGLIATESVTVWNSVPALMQLVVAHGGDAPTRLRTVLLSGDWIPTELPGAIVRTWPDSRVVGLGGATEASIWSIFHEVRPEDAERPSVPYGRALSGQRMHVLDERMEPRPALVTGDLYISGAGLAREYWRDPERTAAAFVRHPRSGELLYATGDVARVQADGEIEFLGRADSQVKVNGHRVELGEIESVLRDHPRVRDAVAAMHGGRTEAKALSAYVMTDGSVPIPELRDHLAGRLPRHAVPDRIVEIDEIPLGTNGKVDRSALTGPDPGVDRPDVPHRRARSGWELAVVDELRDLLPDDGPGSEDPAATSDFFELGGNSLVAEQLAAAIRSRGTELRAAEVMLNPTVAALAELLESRDNRTAFGPAPGDQRAAGG